MNTDKNNSGVEEALVLPVMTDALVTLALDGIDMIKLAGAVSGEQIRAIIELATYGSVAREIIERKVVIPSLADVAAIRARLATAVLASGGNKLAVDSKLIIDQMTDGLRKSEQNRFIADQAIAGYARAFREAPVMVIERICQMPAGTAGIMIGEGETAALAAFLAAIWPADDPLNPTAKREVASNDQ